MENERIDLKAKLREQYFDYDLLQKTDCTDEENETYKNMVANNETLPEGVREYRVDGEGTGLFYAVHQSELTQDEKIEYLIFNQLKLLNTIKNCVVFFTVLTIISMVLSLLIVLFTL